MIDSFLTALSQWFFLRSLLVVILLAVVFPLYGNIVIVRQEANIAHTFAHIWLLWVAIGLRYDRPIELSIFGSIVATIVFLFFLGSQTSQDQVTHNEIWAQLWLVWAILIVSQMSGYKADITSYLFGDILLLGSQDVYVILGIMLVCALLYRVYGRQRYALSLHSSLAKSKNISVNSTYFIYLLALGLLIGGAMKIIWVLLVSAFLVLPSNISKLIAKNKTQRDMIAVCICCIVSIVWLFVSWYMDTPSGASIVALLILIYLVCMIPKRIK